MRDFLQLIINGKRHSVAGRDAFLSLSDFLRLRLGLIGSKIVCSEGDCGACTVLVGRPTLTAGSPDDPWQYRPVDSCIAFMFQLDGVHIVTVEGLSPRGELNSVQQAMIDCHGSQCGFCTPGFVVQMTALRERRADLSAEDLRYGLTGNLCRCTGYTPILEAGVAAGAQEHRSLDELYPPRSLSPRRSSSAPASAAVSQNGVPGGDLELCAVSAAGQPLLVRCPATLAGALEFLADHPDALIVAGATDVGVRANKSGKLPPAILDLNRVAELDFVRSDDRALVAGARASWTTLEEACETLVPEFHQILTRFGSPQIRHAGTIAGNIANASPIADSLPLLFVMEATVKLRSSAVRTVPIIEFYHGYKQLEMTPYELITEVRIPLPEPDEMLRLYKVSRRRDLDISSFTAAVRMRLDGQSIDMAKIAFGAVGPTVLRATQTETFLSRKPFTEATLQAAGDVAVGEVSPISDVRGSDEYRLQLTRNVLLKFYHQAQQAESAVA